MAGALRYLASLGAGGSVAGGMERIRAYERDLAAVLLTELGTIPGLAILGDADPARVEERVPTVSFTLGGIVPRRIVEHLAARGIQARDGHMYAPRLLSASGIDPTPGLARVSLCHYNTREEIARLGEALRALRA
jgi:selenocysteine lyase/cysteine desulfurase